MSDSNLKYKIQEVLAGASLDGELKKALGEVLAAMQSYDEREVAALLTLARQQNVARTGEVQDWSREFTVTTILVPQKRLREFSELHPIDEGNKGIFYPQWEEELLAGNRKDDDKRPLCEYYWRGSYASLTDFLEQKREFAGVFRDADGQEHGFRYRFVRATKALQQERFLYAIARLYQIERPPVFSPYSRRQLEVRIMAFDGGEAPSLKEFSDRRAEYDLGFARNGLDEYIVADHILTWNIRRLPEEGNECYGSRVEAFPATIGTAMRYRFEFPLDGQNQQVFLTLPLDEVGHRRLPLLRVEEKNENRIVLSLPGGEGDDISAMSESPQAEGLLLEGEEDSLRYWEAEGQTAFTNLYEIPTYGVPARLLSKGDIYRQLARYEQPSFYCRDMRIITSSREVPLCAYQGSEFDYGAATRAELVWRQRGRQRLQALPVCLISFALKETAPAGMRHFLADYACYVLADLTRRYPDCIWRGQLDEGEGGAHEQALD